MGDISFVLITIGIFIPCFFIFISRRSFESCIVFGIICAGSLLSFSLATVGGISYDAATIHKVNATSGEVEHTEVIRNNLELPILTWLGLISAFVIVGVTIVQSGRLTKQGIPSISS